MLFALGSSDLAGAQLTTQAPPSRSSSSSLPDDPSQTNYPTAYAIPDPSETVPLQITSHGPQTYEGHVVTLEDDVVITYRDHTVRADRVTYNRDTDELTATGHLLVTGGANGEHIAASHGTYNLRTATGRFYDVSGSVAMRSRVSHADDDPLPVAPGYAAATRSVYTNGSPFLFTGRMVVKTGPDAYDVYDGTVTACQLPRPDWMLSSAHLNLDGEQARAHGSVFRLLNVPILYLPYVTHPIDPEDRQSGFLTPTVGQSSTKGFILGEQVYMVLGRSADLTVGADYYSSRGFAQNATFRYRGQGLDFVQAHYSGLLDRGFIQNGVYTNQGGEDVTFAGRRDFNANTRAAANVEYLSSYVYREAFTDNFNQAVTSDVVSTAYIEHQAAGYEFAGLTDRYQGIKLIAQASTGTPQQQVRLFHVPTLQVSSLDHFLGTTGLEYNLDGAASGLKRTQPNFATGGVVERLDLHPELARPFSLEGWHVRPAVAVRETLYSRSRVVPYVVGGIPQESLASLSRSDLELSFDVRPPVLTRTFAPTHLTGFFGTQIRHTIEPQFHYRYTTGVSNFLQVLRFDETDVVSNTNEAEYGVTQRLFRRTGSAQPCRASELPQGGGFSPEAATEPVPDSVPGKGCGNEELITWRLTQKYFFDPTFGNAVLNSRRNIFTSTLDLSGVAFLTEPRNISPLISRLRVRTSNKTDVEWDVDFDTGAKKFTADNVFLDVHQGNTFAALSYSLLDAPGRFYTSGVSSTVSSFNQLRLLIGYGQPSKPGLSVAANTGLDLCPATPQATATTSGTTAQPSASCALLQYAAAQTSYNWNCCGVAFEYRKFELGSVRNENVYRFNFTLANIGSAGNLRRAERLF